MFSSQDITKFFLGIKSSVGSWTWEDDGLHRVTNDYSPNTTVMNNTKGCHASQITSDGIWNTTTTSCEDTVSFVVCQLLWDDGKYCHLLPEMLILF